jgi:hypothetical protein
MIYSFARIGAALGMNGEDVFTQNQRLWVRLHEKDGKDHATHNAWEHPAKHSPHPPPSARIDLHSRFTQAHAALAR